MRAFCKFEARVMPNKWHEYCTKRGARRLQACSELKTNRQCLDRSCNSNLRVDFEGNPT